uniref:Ig-like domain-containing protein n=1 Tax=Callorhinchus milii TaxID=7868 RepID=A0A4W3GBM0_CALMI
GSNCLLLWFTVSQSPPEQTAFAGERINLHCQYSGICRQDFSVSWYRQYPGEELKYLLHTKSSGDGGNPIRNHIFAYLDTAKKISVLTITGLRLTDSTMYHCARSLHHSDTHHRKPRTITLITANAGNNTVQLVRDSVTDPLTTSTVSYKILVIYLLYIWIHHLRYKYSALLMSLYGTREVFCCVSGGTRHESTQREHEARNEPQNYQLWVLMGEKKDLSKQCMSFLYELLLSKLRLNPCTCTAPDNLKVLHYLLPTVRSIAACICIPPFMLITF